MKYTSIFIKLEDVVITISMPLFAFWDPFLGTEKSRVRVMLCNFLNNIYVKGRHI